MRSFLLIKNLILFIGLIVSNTSFGQASGQSDFYIHVEFEKDIPVNDIELFYYTMGHNNIKKISFISDSVKNTIEISGHHLSVVGAGLPVMVFSHRGKIVYDEYLDGSTYPRNDKEVAEIQNLYYLVISKEGFSSADEGFRDKLKFSNDKPNIVIRYENVDGKIRYHVSNESQYYYPVSEMAISNKLVKIRKSEN